MSEDYDDWGSNLCPHCGKPLILPTGKKTSNILLVGEFPGNVEVQQGVPMVGPMGAVVENELMFLGVRMRDLRRCNLWMHEKPSKSSNLDKACFEHGIKILIKEAANKSLILLMGSETVKFLTGYDVMNVSGTIVSSVFFPNSIVVASVNPAIVFHSGIGEMRHAIEVFVKQVENLDK